jgi:hypothetical protein
MSVLTDQMVSTLRTKRERTLLSVMGSTLLGHTVALIIAKSKADAECYAVSELGFVRVDGSALTSDCVYVGPADTRD